MNINCSFILLVFFPLLCHVCIAGEEPVYIPKVLSETDKEIDFIRIGETKLTEINSEFGGNIVRKRDDEGSGYSYLCLVIDAHGHNYLLGVISGAMGGWDIVTEYELEKTSASDKGGCGYLKMSKKPSVYLGRDISYVYSHYGEPKEISNNAAEYLYSYEEPVSGGKASEYILYVFSGITFHLDSDGQVIKVNVFETKSN